MKLILTTNQIKELDGISKADRRELFRLNHRKIYRHWQGWVSFVFYVLLMSTGIVSFRIAPDDTPLWLIILWMIPPILILGAIYWVMFLTTIAPYIQRDVVFWTSKGFITKEIKSGEHKPPEGHGEAPCP